MKRLNFYCMALAVLAIFSCAREQEVLVPESESGMKFTAVWSDEASRTSLDENGTSVLWDPGDEIFIFQGVTEEGPSAMGKFTSTNTARQSSATFTGTLEGECSGDYIAVYPYYEFHKEGTAANMSEWGFGDLVLHMIAPVQQGVEGSFAIKTAPAAAVSGTNELVFHNICGGVRFSIAQSGVKKVSFSSVDGSPMSGIAYIVIGEDGIPVAMMGGMGGEDQGAPPYQSFVDVIAPEGGFVPGKNYYAIMAPQTHADGIKIALYGDGVKAERTLSGPVTVKRSVFGKLDNIDEGLEYKSSVPVPEIVDLGLSVKWASFNLGATKSEEYGNYYAWGEIEPMTSYHPETYKWATAGYYLNKYTTEPKAPFYPVPDNKTVLDLEDDAAAVALGNNWRMPTVEEIEELGNGCSLTFETLNGVSGVRAVSNVPGYTDKSIFIPCAGIMNENGVQYETSDACFWSATLTNNSSILYYLDWLSCYFAASNDGQQTAAGVAGGLRSWGLPVRPVYSGEVVHVTGVALNESSLQIEMGSTAQLIATVTPEDASNKQVVWTSSDESIATVSEDGVVSGVSVGTAVITATTVDGGFTSTCSIDISYHCETPEMVDLGLPSGIKWASFNLGATAPEEYGEYFAWGETEPKSNYSESTYKWCMNGRISQLTKYCNNYNYGYNDFTDNKTVLDPEDDAAAVALGGSWRMATYDEWEELKTKCTWTWTTQNGVNGRLVTGPNGNSIFLPAAGERIYRSLDNANIVGYYWSSSLSMGSYAHEVVFSSHYANNYGYGRYYGFPVRAIYAGIRLNKYSLQLYLGGSDQLIATVTSSGVTNNHIIWSSSAVNVATVTEDGIIRAIGTGTTTITATTVNGGLKATCTVEVIRYEAVTPKAVDLGLSVMWASFNLGASKPEEYGDYFAWGETAPKVDYSWFTYKWCMGNEYTITKYCNDSEFGYNGFTDNKIILDPEDDAAAVALGGSWRMPTEEELRELLNFCTWTEASQNGIDGSLVTGPNGNSIFLPAAGDRYGTSLPHVGSYGAFLSSSHQCGPLYACYLCSQSDYASIDYDEVRYLGLSVRPVYDGPADDVPSDVVHVTSVVLNLSNLQIYKGTTAQLTATVTPEYASNKQVIWTSSDESIATVSEEGMVTGIMNGVSEITATTVDGGFTAECTVTVLEKYKVQRPKMIDLGLSVKWASFNLGATKPEEFGDYFAWGETKPKWDYNWSTYKWCMNGGPTQLTKYCNNSSYGYNGFTDGMYVLDPVDDAATVALGGSWRMPTEAELDELYRQCTWTWTTLNGVIGTKVASKKPGYTDKWIFLPAAGFRNGASLYRAGTSCNYWSSSIGLFQSNAHYMYVSSLEFSSTSEYTRDQGFSVRPVSE